MPPCLNLRKEGRGRIMAFPPAVLQLFHTFHFSQPKQNGSQHQQRRSPGSKVLHNRRGLNPIQCPSCLHPNPGPNPLQSPPTPRRNPLRQTRHSRRAPQAHSSKDGYSGLLPAFATQIRRGDNLRNSPRNRK